MKQTLPAVFFVLFSVTIMAQGIVSVSPTSSPLSTTGVNVTIVLDSAVAPPGTVLPSSVNIGPALGNSVTRTNQYVYATFDFTHMSAGTYNVTILFLGPPPQYQVVYFTIPAAFTVTDTGIPSWTVPGTNVTLCYDTIRDISCPTDPAAPFYGQFSGITPSYVNNGDGTITDTVTGLMWQHDPGAKKTFIEALSGAVTSTLGGYNDWRMPTIKEMYSLIEFTGVDPNVRNGTSLSILTPFIDTNYFVFHYGDTTNGYRIIDSQYWTCTEFVSVVMKGDHSIFGVNFADGRIKSYPRQMMSTDNKLYTQYVRGGKGYGINRFTDNGNGTISDSASLLMWTKEDSHAGMNWQAALTYAQTMNASNFCGHNDWRVPHTKELESIIDYSRSPQTTHSAAIDPVFQCTQITDEAGHPNWPWYWATTTHASFDGLVTSGSNGVYVCFGSAFGWQTAPGNSYMTLTDVHGAGAQRSSPKCGTYLGDSLGVDSLGHTVYGRGPQGDVLRVNNYVRLVRTLKPMTGMNHIPGAPTGAVAYPNPFQAQTTIRLYSVDMINNAELVIYDVYGQRVRTVSGINSNTITVRREGLSTGIYLYRIMSNGSLFAQGRLIAE